MFVSLYLFPGCPHGKMTIRLPQIKFFDFTFQPRMTLTLANEGTGVSLTGDECDLQGSMSKCVFFSFALLIVDNILNG